MTSPYVSSIMKIYGDPENIKTDVTTLREIIARQGTNLLIDCVAESIGEVSNKFHLTKSERMNIYNAEMELLKNAILERI